LRYGVPPLGSSPFFRKKGEEEKKKGRKREKKANTPSIS
jgi:hypothetical protein